MTVNIGHFHAILSYFGSNAANRGGLFTEEQVSDIIQELEKVHLDADQGLARCDSPMYHTWAAMTPKEAGEKLNLAFGWTSDTPQGYEFWDEIHECLMNEKPYKQTSVGTTKYSKEQDKERFW